MLSNFVKAMNRKLWWYRYRKMIVTVMFLAFIMPLGELPWWMRLAIAASNWWTGTGSSSTGPSGGGGGGGF